MKIPSPRAVLSTLAVCGALFYAAWGGEYSAWDLWQLERRQQEEIAAAAQIRAQTADLRQTVERLKTDPIALERVARERFGMIRPGEVLFRFVAPEPRQARSETP